MPYKESRLRKLENTFKLSTDGIIYITFPGLPGLKYPTETGDLSFPNYIVTLDEFEHITTEHFGLITHILREVDPSIKDQFGEEGYNDIVTKQKKDAEGFEDCVGWDLQDFREAALLNILDYPHKINFDLKTLGKRMISHIEEFEQRNEFTKPGNRISVPKESDFSLEKFIPMVRQCPHIEYIFN